MRKHQTGQAFPLGLALILFAALGALVLFNTGKTATDKARLANTADAAAYSGLLWQARALNFQSYTNRAMVANQVSIAQAVSLRSWVLYGRVSTENINTVLQGVPLVNVVSSAMQEIMTAVEEIVGPITEAMVQVVDQVNGVLSTAQRAMYASSFTATPEIVQQVVKANDERFSNETHYGLAALGKNLSDWKSFTAGYDQEDIPDMRRKADVVKRSLDRFSQKRKWKFFKYWMPLSPFTLIRLEREGATHLVERVSENGIEFEWKAKDNLSFNTRIWRPFRSWKRVEVPIGWGEAFANERGIDTIEQPDAGSPSPFQPYTRWFRRNAWAEYNGDYGVRSLQGSESLQAIDGYHGMRAYRSLSARNRATQDPRLELRVEVSMDLNTIRSSDHFTAGSTFSAPLVSPGDVLTSIGVAELFYEKPVENGIRSEQEANGYNPYWDVRLKAVPAADRVMAVALRPSGSSVASTPDTNNGLDDYVETTAVELQAIGGQLLEGEADGAGMSAFDGQSIAALESQVASLQSEFSSELENTQDAIESGIEDALDNALESILAGAVSGIGIDLQNAEQVRAELGATQDWIDGLQGDFDEVVANGEARANAVREEFERIRVEVGEAYVLERDRIVADHLVYLEELNADLREAQAAISRSFNSNQGREQAERRLEAARGRLHDAQDVLYTELAGELQNIVNAQSEFIELSFDDAYQAVKLEYLSDDDIVEQLGISEILDEDESEYD